MGAKVEECLSESRASPAEGCCTHLSLFLTPLLPLSGTNGSLAEDTCLYNIGTVQCVNCALRSLGMIVSFSRPCHSLYAPPVAEQEVN